MLPIGRGKSLLFIVLAYLNYTSVTIVIVLFYGLIKDLVIYIYTRSINCIE
ncbi:hypothetical protein PMIN01_06323 [Paraphaeosphaeria minitans]|uniref:Uncharacterized protein n=1 Tax=Paraphaeosphaeria minitans TaxID=565426 RepID=A0A9P6GIS2_9PLEO|nr:hypothetical protein PMIN01_06323 [Paraphaeosphaeria minitans]